MLHPLQHPLGGRVGQLAGDAAVDQEHHPVGMGGRGRVVGDHDHGLAELLGFLRRSVDEYGQTIVMVTHDPTAAAHADQVLFLADGKIVDELADPTPEKVLDVMKRLGG